VGVGMDLQDHCKRLIDLKVHIDYVCFVFISVANKWFHERGQEFVRQCAKSEHEYE